MKLKKYVKMKKGRKFGPYFMKTESGKSQHISEFEYLQLSANKKTQGLSRRKKRDLYRDITKESFNNPLKETLKAAGYSLRGDTIHLSLKRFFTLDAARIRYALLSSENQKLVKSPEVLLQLSQKAWELHKKLNLLKEHNTFAGCFELLLLSEQKL